MPTISPQGTQERTQVRQPKFARHIWLPGRRDGGAAPVGGVFHSACVPQSISAGAIPSSKKPSIDHVLAELVDRAFEGAGPLLSAFELIPRIAVEFLREHRRHPRPACRTAPLVCLARGGRALAGQLGRARGDGGAGRRARKGRGGRRRGGRIGNAGARILVPARDPPSPKARRRQHQAQRLRAGLGDPGVPRRGGRGGRRPHPRRASPCLRPFGDGNIHYNISQPKDADKDAYLARWDEVSDAVHAIVLRFGGSISAEHGIGRMKAHALESVKSPVELALMRRLKAAFDPRGILIPAKCSATPAPAEKSAAVLRLDQAAWPGCCTAVKCRSAQAI